MICKDSANNLEHEIIRKQIETIYIPTTSKGTLGPVRKSVWFAIRKKKTRGR